jgi:hypothetical protein
MPELINLADANALADYDALTFSENGVGFTIGCQLIEAPYGVALSSRQTKK